MCVSVSPLGRKRFRGCGGTGGNLAAALLRKLRLRTTLHGVGAWLPLEPSQGDWQSLPLDSLGLCAKKSSVPGRVANSKGCFSLLGAERLSHWPRDGQSQAASTTWWLSRVRRDQLRPEKLTMPQNSPSDTLTHRYTDTHTPHPH